MIVKVPHGLIWAAGTKGFDVQRHSEKRKMFVLELFYFIFVAQQNWIFLLGPVLQWKI